MKILLLFLFCLVGSLAIKGDFRYSSSARYFEIGWFGFLKKGTAFVEMVNEVQYQDVNLDLIICSESQYLRAFGYFSPSDCPTVKSRCAHTFSMNGTGNLTVDWVSPSNKPFYFIIANCERRFTSTQVNYVFLNPGGEHLTSGQIPLPYLYAIFAVLWGFISIFWCSNWITNRNQKVVLHRIISSFPICKIVVLSFSAWVFSYLSQNGEISLAAIVFYYLFIITFRTLFYTILLLIASGWGICQDSLGSKKVTIAVGAISIAVCNLIGVFVHNFFFLFALVAYIIVTVLIFKYINQNIFYLSGLAQNSSNNQPNTDSKKRDMFSRFRNIFVSYILIIILLNIIGIFLLFNYAWIDIFFVETLEMGLFLCIAWTFRLRKQNIYYQLETDDHVEMSSQPAPTTPYNLNSENDLPPQN